MPFVEVFTREKLSDEIRMKLADELSNTTMTVEIGRPTEFFIEPCGSQPIMKRALPMTRWFGYVVQRNEACEIDSRSGAVAARY